MIALLQRETDSLSQLRPTRDVISRALEQQNASQQASDVKPLSVTYLGGSSSGRISVHIYAVEIQASGGQYQFFPLALTIVGARWCALSSAHAVGIGPEVSTGPTFGNEPFSRDAPR